MPVLTLDAAIALLCLGLFATVVNLVIRIVAQAWTRIARGAWHRDDRAADIFGAFFFAGIAAVAFTGFVSFGGLT